MVPEFLEFMRNARTMQELNPTWRWGRCLFNALHELNPKLAESIRGTGLDPFHKLIPPDGFYERVNREISAMNRRWFSWNVADQSPSWWPVLVLRFGRLMLMLGPHYSDAGQTDPTMVKYSTDPIEHH